MRRYVVVWMGLLAIVAAEVVITLARPATLILLAVLLAGLPLGRGCRHSATVVAVRVRRHHPWRVIRWMFSPAAGRRPASRR